MSITMSRIKQEATSWGSEYFSPKTMEFFQTRLSNKIHEGPGGIHFVMSDRGYAETDSRRYKVRRVSFDEKDIDIVGRYEGYTSEAEAHEVAARLAAGEVA